MGEVRLALRTMRAQIAGFLANVRRFREAMRRGER